MFTAEAAEELLLGEERPRLVVDCIDDVKTKLELLAFCAAEKLPVVSALGSGAKDDPTKICVAQGLRDIDNDPLATKLRKGAAAQGLDLDGIFFVYSSQKVQRALLPLSDEQRANPEEFGSVANFRLRVIPVLGTQPAAAGMAIAAQVLNLLNGLEDFEAQPTPAPRRNLIDKLLDSFKREELKRGGRACLTDVTPAEASFMVHEVWLGRSALDPSLDAFAATGIRFTLTRWDQNSPPRAGNLILATAQEAEKHRTPEDAPPEVRARVEAALRRAERALARPLLQPTADRAETAASAAAAGRCQSAARTEGRLWPQRCETVWDAEEAALVQEQLSRSAAFLGKGQEKLQGAFVVIVGLGAVGSSAAILLARAGVGHLRLVDGSPVRRMDGHALAKATDVGRHKVEVCKEVMLAVLPHLDIEAVPSHLTEGREDECLAPRDGDCETMILDCVGGFRSKELIMRYALARHVRVVSVCTTAAPCPADPSRVAVAPLGEVWAWPACAELRGRLAQEDPEAFKDIEVVHSQEPALWAKPSCTSALSHRLQLGATAAAAVMLRLTGTQVAHQADPCGMNFWKKLRNSLERSESGDTLPDLHAVGCVADYLWRARSALSGQMGAKHSDMAMVRWDRSKPVDLANLVLLTAEEAQRHLADTKRTGSLPPEVLDGRDVEDCPWRRTHGILQKLRAHLEASDRGRVEAEPFLESRATQAAVAMEGKGEMEKAPRQARSGFLGLVGETPLVELRCLSQSTGRKILGKAEFLSPGGCQKDRVARQILEEAVAGGALNPGATVVEGTSGSTGISLSLAAAALGFKVHVVMPDDQAKEKAEQLRRFGATVQMVRPVSISSPEHYVNVARRHAQALNAEKGPGAALFADQFENPANFRAHYEGTGPELWRQCEAHGENPLDAFVMSAGTGGTLAGVGRYLKERSPNTKVVLADVPGSALYFKVAKGVLYAPEQEERSIRRHRQDTIAEGIGNDRLTANLALGLEEHSGFCAVDGAVQVSDQEALQMSQHLLAHEGLFLGSSAAVNCVAAVKVGGLIWRVGGVGGFGYPLVQFATIQPFWLVSEGSQKETTQF
ncbi:unnamed protein product [Effrenium voratum]|nr:unnamed protein product [Effrenium voratum]